MIKLNFNSRDVLLLVLSAATIWLSACMTTAPTSAVIEQRATARWEAVLSDDIDVAYEFLSPGYRSSVSLKQYHRSLLLKQINWTAAKYVESDCGETACNVKILLDFTIYGAVPGAPTFDSKQTIEESWVLVNGSWYLVPKN